MRLGDKSANALTWFAAIVLVFGQMAMHPTFRLGIAIFTAVIAVVVIIFGRTKFRIFAGVVLLLALFIAIPAYSEHNKFMDTYATYPKLREVVAFGRTFGEALDRHRLSAKALPKSTDDLGVPIPRDKIADVLIETDDLFTVTLSIPSRAGKQLVFVAETKDGTRTWKCMARDKTMPRPLPASCSEDYEDYKAAN